MNREQGRALVGISLSQLLLLSLWMSSAAVGPRLQDAWGLTAGQVAGLTMAVQLGFVVGSAGLIVSGLADLLPTRRLFALSALVALAANVSLVLLDRNQFSLALMLRLATGIGLAGGYPSALKAVAGWFRDDLGSATGWLIGALTVGAGIPYLVASLDLGWQQILVVASGLAGTGAIIMLVLVRDGPFDPPPVRVSLSHLRRVVTDRKVRLISIAYFGHNWELFALWTWIGVFLAASARAGGQSEGWTPVVAFASIAAGGAGAWAAGRWSDRYGRIPVARLALIISGGASLLTPVVFGLSAPIVAFFFVVWGIAVVADSPLFSVMVTEAADETTRGTALTLQLAVGFLVPLITIGMVPALADLWSWRYAFVILAAGPLVAIIALNRLETSDA